MKRALMIAGAVGCGGVPSATPVPPVAKPAPKTPPLSLHDEWGSVAGDLVARTPAGPFADLAAVCVALDRAPSENNYEGCHTSEDEELGGGPFVRIGAVQTWEPQAPGDDMPARLEYLAIQTRVGWYVLPKFGETGDRYSSLFFQAKRANNGIVIDYRYEQATAGRFASDFEEGIVACEAAGGAIACTPKIPTRKYSTQMNTSEQDWPSSTDVEIACTATYTAGVVTIAPMPKPPPDSADTWTVEAAEACKGLGYAGSHPVTY